MLQPLTRSLAEKPLAADTLLSVIVPVRNEGDNILPLFREIMDACADGTLEVIYIDDGSTDETPNKLVEARALAAGRLRILRHRRSCGQSAAVTSGVRASCGRWIVTLDGDGQNDPADIPLLLARAMDEERMAAGPVLVIGHRTRRRDSWAKRLSSRLANRIRAAILSDDTPDTGCGLKVFRREPFLDLPNFDHMHRFLPALFHRAGGRVVTVPVNHRPRISGRSNYGTFDRLWVGIFDLAGVFWLQRRSRRPELE